MCQMSCKNCAISSRQLKTIKNHIPFKTAKCCLIIVAIRTDDLVCEPRSDVSPTQKHHHHCLISYTSIDSINPMMTCD